MLACSSVPGEGGSVVVTLVGWGTAYITDSAFQGDGITYSAAAWVENCAGGLFMRGATSTPTVPPLIVEITFSGFLGM